MKKTYILSLTTAVVVLTALSSCDADKDPVIDTSVQHEFVLNTPPLANQFTDLSQEGGEYTFTVSQPDYGVTVAPDYGIEISLNPDFTATTDEPVITSDGESHIVPATYNVPLESQILGVLVVKMSNIAAGINELNGVFEEAQYQGDYEGPLYVRATAVVGSSPSTAAVSEGITLANVKGFASFPATESYLWFPGGSNGWTFDPEGMRLFSYTPDSPEAGVAYYHGFANLSGEFKINAAGAWTHPGDYGADETGLTPDGGVYKASLVENGANFNAPAPGLYWVEAEITNPSTANDQVAGTFSLTPITSVGVCGDFNGWNEQAPVELSPDNAFQVWTAEAANVTSGGWKFVFNHSWTLNLGGEPDDLEVNGSNLSVDAAGVELDLSTLPYTARFK